MNRVFRSFIAIFTFLVLVSCNEGRLDIPQKGVYAEEEFYKTDEDCEQAVAAIYSDIRSAFLYYHFCITELPGDDCYKGASGYKLDDCHTLMLSLFDENHDYIRHEFQKLYSIVYRCNLVIDHFKDDDSPVKKQGVAEALTLRSWAYIYLIQIWGHPPIVDHVLRTSDEFQQPNAFRRTLWDFVINSLDEAIESNAMQSKKGVHDKTAVRATREFAMALKGKAQVIAGDYAQAKETLRKVIDSGKYELIPSEDLSRLFFSSEGNHNCESIFETNIGMNKSNYKKVSSYDNWYSYCALRVDKLPIMPKSYLSRYIDGWQYFQPTEPFLRDIIANEGTQSYRFKAWFYTYEDMQELGLGSLNAHRSEKTQQLLDSFPADEPNPDLESNTTMDHTGEMMGIWHRKFLMGPDEPFNGDANCDGVDRRYFRYAEVLLLYAEACAQLGETGGDGLKALNEVASRAGAPTYDILTLDNVKKEKRYEMWGEGTRFFDLVRWGDAASVLSEHWNRLPVFYGYKEGKSKEDISPDGRNIFDVYEIRMFDLEKFTNTSYSFQVGKHEYMPYPASELANNPLLRQNVGW